MMRDATAENLFRRDREGAMNEDTLFSVASSIDNLCNYIESIRYRIEKIEKIISAIYQNTTAQAASCNLIADHLLLIEKKIAPLDKLRVKACEENTHLDLLKGDELC